MNNQTPLPWRLAKSGHGIYKTGERPPCWSIMANDETSDRGPSCIASCNTDDAELIVRAVNLLPELVNALDEFINFAEPHNARVEDLKCLLKRARGEG